MSKQRVAVAAIKISQSGPRRILEEFLEKAEEFARKNNVVFDVYIGLKSNELKPYQNVNYICVNKIYLRTFLLRFIWDNISVKVLTKKYKYIHWFSIQDFSLNVSVPHSVYIHNPLFYAKPNLFWIRYEIKEVFRAIAMKFFIGYNISSNSFIVVQQKFVKDELLKRYKNIPEIFVAPPSGIYVKETIEEKANVGCSSFFYPAMPRIFKGHNFLFDCAQSNPDILFYVTLSGTENSLSKMLYKRYGHLKNVFWLGQLSKEDVAHYYELCDFVFFPSELETWGLPLTESRLFGKPVLVISDSEYLEGPLAGYESVFSIERQINVFKEFKDNPLKYRIHLEHNCEIIDWLQLCRLICNAN